MNDLSVVEALIGYVFADKRLLETALTHSSFVNEHAVAGNERIEFLGDCVLNFVVGEKLFFDDPAVGEGKLSARRAAIVSRGPLSRLVDELGLIKYLRVGAGVNKSDFSDKARSDLLEAVIGAVYVDGGLDTCSDVLDNIFFGKVKPERDYKSELQELAGARGAIVAYTTSEEATGFCAEVTVGENRFFGRGKTKHSAQIDAARAAVSSLNSKR